MTPVRLFLLLIIATGIGAVPRLFSRHSKASNGGSKHRLLHGVKDSLKQQKHAHGSGQSHSRTNLHGKKQGTGLKKAAQKGRKSLKEELEALSARAEWVIEGVGQILVASDNIAIEDNMLSDIDDRLVLLYKYYHDDLEELLNYLKQVTDTTVMKQIKREEDLDDDEEFVITGGVTPPDPDVVGDWDATYDSKWD